MEKYLVIFLIAIVMYVLFKCLTDTKEGFADAQTIDGVDDNNAINTLAKIAKDLQEGGGLKVMGKLNLRDKHVFSSDDDGWLRLKNKELNQMTNYAVKDLWVDGSLTTQGGFKGGLFGDSSTGSSIGLYHPINKYALFSIAASTPDGNKPGWNQVNIRADDLQLKNANNGNTTVTTNGNHIVTEKLVVKNRDILQELNDLIIYTNRLKTRINFEGDRTIMNFQGAEVRNISCHGGSRALHQGCNFWNAFG